MVPIHVLAAVALVAADPVDVTVQVVAPDGSPIAGALVVVWDDTFSLDGIALESDGTPRDVHARRTKTDADGMATVQSPFNSRPPASVEKRAVSITAEGRAPHFGVYEITGRKVDVGRVSLAPGADVHVRVSCEGKPCSERIPLQLVMPSDTRNGWTDASGVAEFRGLRAGSGQVRVAFHKWNQPGERVGEANFSASAGRNMIDLVAERTGAGLEISGRVVDPLGPAHGVVSAMCAGVSRSSKIGADGTFALQDLPAAECVVVAGEPMTFLPEEQHRRTAVRMTPPGIGAVLTLPKEPPAPRDFNAR